MDILFKCSRCDQELSADAGGAGTEIECPSCGTSLVIPHAEPDRGGGALNVITTSAAAKEHRHFAVPQHDQIAETLIAKPLQPLEAAAKNSEKTLRVKTLRRSDCVEVGKDHFDEVVTKFLEKVGEPNVVSINTLNYTHMDLATRQWVTDFGVLIVYKG